jgi:polygalacturonase
MRISRNEGNQSHRRDFIRAGLLGIAAGTSACATGAVRGLASVFDIRSHGARGDGTTNDTAAIQSALDACAKNGGGTVHVGPGRYVAAGLRLSSNTRLYLESGATILGSHRYEDYAGDSDPRGKKPRRHGVISAIGAHNITIEGGGTLDGQALAFSTDDLSHVGTDYDPRVIRQGEKFLSERPFPDGPFRRGDKRPGNIVYMRDCQNVVMRGITVQNSPVWNIHMVRCQRVVVEGLDINSRDSGLRIPNDDGIDFTDCESVHVSNCSVETGDDCIVLFGSRGVTVNNCRLKTRSTAIRVGYDGAAPIRGCTFSNIVITDSNRGIGVFVRGAGDIEDVSFANCTIATRLFTGRWWGKGEPIQISCSPYDPTAKRLGQIRGIRFDNIRARSPSGIVVWGHPDSVISELNFSNVDLSVQSDPLNDSYGGNFDLRLTDDVRTNLFAHDIPGLFARRVDDLRIDGLTLRWPQSPAEFCSSGIHVEDFSRLRISGFDGAGAGEQHPAISLARGRNALISHNHQRGDTAHFLKTDDVSELTTTSAL